ncbi:zinc metalloproteinase nas-15 [Trichonephila clavata]|uniref:Metalloendopeptidase n=1 Tax=Trichonephila clavata TaxID=2740835 RepID=A0A8X6G7S4_TRICU|nr:zinc metalloproteinase nas-15 [Trichonephila clavata]
MFPLSLFATVLLIGFFDAVLNLPRQPYPIENLGHNRRLFQGDIYLRNLTLSEDRFATKHEWLKWPNGVVPYTLDEIYSESEKQLIRSAMDEFEKRTCIKWIEKTDEDNYVEIYSEMGCYSDLGRTGGVQSLSLESPDCMEKGVIMHELMHALGFLHEQSRFDRDEYVQVEWDNIMDGMKSHFEKLYPVELNDLGLEYDYRSIMHYRAWMYAKDGSLPTLRPKDDSVSLKTLGDAQTEGIFTELDIQKINKFYECP